jgi:hypothetical protein
MLLVTPITTVLATLDASHRRERCGRRARRRLERMIAER